MIIEIEAQIFVNAIAKQECLYDLMAMDDTYFELSESKKLFSLLKDLYDTGQNIDMPVVFSKMRDEKIVLSDKYMEHILKGMPSVNFPFLLRSIQKREKKKNVMLLAKDLYNSVKQGIEYDEFIQRLIEIEINSEHDDGGIEIHKFPDDLEEIFHKNNYIKTGLRHLDKKINGFFNGQLIVIAGRPKKGKTTLAIQIMKNIQTGILFFSLEMKRTEIYSKILSGDTSIESWKIEAQKLTTDEKERVIAAHFEAKKKYRFKIYDTDININKIISILKKERQRYRIVFIDYLQLIPGAKGENQNLKISNITRDLKLMAHTLNVPIVVISQLNREVSKEDRRPELSDLRDSGSIEQNADIILFTHEKKDKTHQIIVGGNRKGSDGEVGGIQFVKEFSRFDDEVDI